MSKKKRKIYSREFKVEAVGLITKKGYSIAEASMNMKPELFKLDKLLGLFADESELVDHVTESVMQARENDSLRVS